MNLKSKLHFICLQVTELRTDVRFRDFERLCSENRLDKMLAYDQGSFAGFQPKNELCNRQDKDRTWNTEDVECRYQPS